jgi:hypothetical protein
VFGKQDISENGVPDPLWCGAGAQLLFVQLIQ